MKPAINTITNKSYDLSTYEGVMECVKEEKEWYELQAVLEAEAKEKRKITMKKLIKRLIDTILSFKLSHQLTLWKTHYITAN